MNLTAILTFVLTISASTFFGSSAKAGCLADTCYKNGHKYCCAFDPTSTSFLLQDDTTDAVSDSNPNDKVDQRNREESVSWGL